MTNARESAFEHFTHHVNPSLTRGGIRKAFEHGWNRAVLNDRRERQAAKRKKPPKKVSPTDVDMGIVAEAQRCEEQVDLVINDDRSGTMTWPCGYVIERVNGLFNAQQEHLVGHYVGATKKGTTPEEAFARAAARPCGMQGCTLLATHTGQHRG